MNKTIYYLKSGGLSSGVKVGLIIFFIMMVLLVIIGIVIYCNRKRHSGFRLQFAHKAFRNPIHSEDDDMANDEMKIEFMKEEEEE